MSTEQLVSSSFSAAPSRDGRLHRCVRMLEAAFDSESRDAVEIAFRAFYELLVEDGWVRNDDDAQHGSLKIYEYLSRRENRIVRPVGFVKVLLANVRKDRWRKRRPWLQRFSLSSAESAEVDRRDELQAECIEGSGVFRLDELDTPTPPRDALRGQLDCFIAEYIEVAARVRGRAGLHIQTWALMRLDHFPPAHVAQELGVERSPEAFYQWATRGALLVRRMAEQDQDQFRAAAMKEALARTSRASRRS